MAIKRSDTGDQITCGSNRKETEIFLGDPFTSILFDKTVALWRVGALLPSLLADFEQKHHARIESVTTVASGEQQGTLLLLRHTSPQDGKEPLM